MTRGALWSLVLWGGALVAPPAFAWQPPEGVPPMSIALEGGSVRLRLEEGWKTYGPDPGPYGYPPVVSAVESSNVASWSLDWPVALPQESFGVPFSGYARDVAIPLSVEPLDPNLPARLVLSWDVAACARVCVPVSGTVVWRARPSP